MLWSTDTFVSLDDVLVEWSKETDEPKFELLRRLSEHFRQIGQPFEIAFRDLADRNTIFGPGPALEVAEGLCSTIRGTREDAKSELSRLQISAVPLRDYCRITRTRLPTVAAKRRGVSQQGIPADPVPPCRDLTEAEIAQARAPWAQLMQEAQQRQLPEELRLGKPFRWVNPAFALKVGVASGKTAPTVSVYQRRTTAEARGRAGREPAPLVLEEAISKERSSTGSPPAAPGEKPISATAETEAAQRVAGDEGGVRRRPSEAALREWYISYIAAADPKYPPSRDESWGAAKAAFPDNHVTRDAIRSLRREHSVEWSRRGRRAKTGGAKLAEK